MSNIDRRLLPYPAGVLAINQPVHQAPLPPGYTPSFMNVGLVPGSVVTIGKVARPCSVGQLQVEPHQIDVIPTEAGCGMLMMEGVDGTTRDRALFRSLRDYDTFVLEKLGPVDTLYDALIPKGQYALHMMRAGQTIELRAGDMILSWVQEKVHFARNSLPSPCPINSDDMVTIMPLIPESHCPSMSCRDVLLHDQMLLNIWQNVANYMQCWQYQKVAGQVKFTLNDAAYASYEAKISPLLLQLQVLGVKRKLSPMMVVDDDDLYDGPAAKKQKA
jgi:hypothetical protein